jgi:protein O-mannosyl-transferase
MSAPFPRIAGALSVLVPIALYLPTLGFGFVFDDRPLLIDNPVVAAPTGLVELLTTDLDPKARSQDTPSTNYLRPLFLLLAAGLHQLFGDEPLGWHGAAILLHGLLGGLGFLVLRREGFGVGTALCASLLFSCHPAHVQTTAWVSGLQDLLFGVLALLAFLAYRTSLAAARPTPARLLVLALVYALALLAKEPAVGLLLFVALELALARDLPRRPWIELSLLAALTAAFLAYRWFVLGKLAHPFPTAPAWPEALASVPLVVLVYLRDLLLPVDLFLLNPTRPVESWLGLRAFGAAAALALLIVLAFVAMRRQPRLLRPLLFFVAWLAPVLALWAINPEWLVMDRYLLLPSLALGWILALFLPWESGRPARWLWPALIVILAAFSVRDQRVFRDEDVFWRAAIVADPGSSTALTEWAKRQALAGDLEAAEQSLARAIELDPRAQLPRLRRALLALSRGQAAQAVLELEALIERNPGYLPAWRNLVVARSRSGDSTGVWRTLESALARFPADPELWVQRTVLLRNSGRLDEALVANARALALAPGDPAGWLRQASLLAENGRDSESRAAVEQGLLLDPPPPLKVQLEALRR